MLRVLVSWRARAVLAVAALLVAAASSGATAARTASAATVRQCSAATLSGTYLFAGDGLSISGSARTPLAFAGSERFDGAGHVAGTNSFSFGGAITRQAGFTGTYTLASNCLGTLTIGSSLHFDFYASPSGDQFDYVQTDSGSVSATTEHRVSREADPRCRTATLSGRYLFAGDGLSISGTAQTPLAFAGSERFDGAGHVAGTNSFSFGGAITRQAAFSGTYTLAANCLGTLTIGGSLHFDVYVSPSGDQFDYVQTDSGSVSATTEHRA